MVDNDMEEALGRLAPPSMRPELRSQVLAAVASQLVVEPATQALRRSALAVAACLVIAVAMNLWQSDAAARRLARLYGPPPISKRAMDLARTVETTTDAQTAEWAYQRYAASHRSGNQLAAYAAYSDLLSQLVAETFVVAGESYDETL